MSRPAHISPSQFKRLMAKRGLGAGAETYADELVQKMIGVEQDDFTSWDMTWGILNEPLAVRAYEEQNLVSVKTKERKVHEDYRFISGEADGLVGNRGAVEIKCPNSKNHQRNRRDGDDLQKYIKQYIDQIQGYMWIYKLDWVDFLSFDPRFPYERMQLFTKRIYRDQDHIDLIEERCLEFWGMVRDRYRIDMGYENKINLEEAEEIRTVYKNTEYTMRSLAIEFGVSQSTISAIVRNKIYKR